MSRSKRQIKPMLVGQPAWVLAWACASHASCSACSANTAKASWKVAWLTTACTAACCAMIWLAGKSAPFKPFKTRRTTFWASPCQSAATKACKVAARLFAGRDAAATLPSKASLPLKRAPVKPKNVPLPNGKCCKNQVPPASGYRPMLISGMAMTVVSVTMVWLAALAKPMPPPITMPVAQQTTGLG